jgi:hypothetical protein
MRVHAVIALIAAAGLLAGCDWAQRVGAKVNPDSIGFADRCASIMQAAMPFAEIDIGRRTSANTGLRTIAAQAEGTRADLSQGAPRDLAVECQFEDSILTGFRWTKGGPSPSPAAQ